MELQLQNWENFCRYQATGDWHGTWTRYSPQGEGLESFQCIRSLQTSKDGSEINHQNQYTYADGKNETKTFGPYKKPNTRALFLDNSFSWGSTQVKSGSTFGFETGFRYEDKRATLGVMYNDSCNLQQITAISEQLGSFAKEPPRPPTNALTGNWQGTRKTMTPDFSVSPPEVTSWQRLDDLGEDYLTLHFPDGISLSCPRQVETGTHFFMAVDWLINPALSLRGIRHYAESGFTKFTLEEFRPNPLL